MSGVLSKPLMTPWQLEKVSDAVVRDSSVCQFPAQKVKLCSWAGKYTALYSKSFLGIELCPIVRLQGQNL